MNELPFGDYLAQLLRERDCSGHRMADMLGIDTSLVYRWLRNEAVSKLAAPYRDMITSLLDLTQVEAARLKEAQISSSALEARDPGKAIGASCLCLQRFNEGARCRRQWATTRQVYQSAVSETERRVADGQRNDTPGSQFFCHQQWGEQRCSQATQQQMTSRIERYVDQRLSLRSQLGQRWIDGYP